MVNEDYPYKPTNREKSKQAKKRLFWCWCDRNMVGQYGKCFVCGRIDKKKNK